MIKFILTTKDFDSNGLLIYPVKTASNYDELIQNLNKVYEKYDNFVIYEMDIVIKDEPPIKHIYASGMWINQFITLIKDFESKKKTPFEEFINFYAYAADLTGFAIKLENIEIYDTVEGYIDKNLPLNPFEHMMENNEIYAFIPENMPYYNYDIIVREVKKAGNSFILKDGRYIVFK